MAWLLGAFVFWLALHGELGTYAGFVTTANPSGTLGTIFAAGTAKANSPSASLAPGVIGSPSVAGGMGSLGGAFGSWLGGLLAPSGSSASQATPAPQSSAPQSSAPQSSAPSTAPTVYSP